MVSEKKFAMILRKTSPVIRADFKLAGLDVECGCRLKSKNNFKFNPQKQAEAVTRI